MKKALSIVLSVAMLMTAMFTLFVVPASAEEAPHTYELLKEEYIAEGAEFVTINDDGTWTIEGGEVALAPNVVYDYTVHYNVIQKFSSTNGVSITFLDRDPDGVYEDHWINLFGQWDGRSYYEAGDVDRTDSIKGVYDWCTKYAGWTNPAGKAAVRAVYIDPNGGTVTMKSLALNDGVYTYYFDADARYDYNTVYDLAVKDADAWTGIPASGSEATVTVDGDAVAFGNTAANWPSAFIDFDEPIVINDEAVLDVNFAVKKGAKTTIYLFFGNATCNEFDSGAYAVVHNQYGGEVAAGNYEGFVHIEDILPTDEAARAACYNADGDLVLTGIKVFAVSEGADAMDPAVVINKLDLCYVAKEDVEPEPGPGDDEPVVKAGDLDGNGALNMMDVLALNNITSGKIQPNDAQKAAGDMDGNGALNMMDVLKLYNITSGKIVA